MKTRDFRVFKCFRKLRYRLLDLSADTWYEEKKEIEMHIKNSKCNLEEEKRKMEIAIFNVDVLKKINIGMLISLMIVMITMFSVTSNLADAINQSIIDMNYAISAEEENSVNETDAQSNDKNRNNSKAAILEQKFKTQYDQMESYKVISAVLSLLAIMVAFGEIYAVNRQKYFNAKRICIDEMLKTKDKN